MRVNYVNSNQFSRLRLHNSSIVFQLSLNHFDQDIYSKKRISNLTLSNDNNSDSNAFEDESSILDSYDISSHANRARALQVAHQKDL